MADCYFHPCFDHCRNANKANACTASLAIYPCNLKTSCNAALILLQNKAFGTWNSLMQKYGFPENVSICQVLQIGSQTL